MSKALIRQNSSLTGSNIWILVLVIGLVWLVAKGGLLSTAQYNEESVTIARDERGRIAGMTVHRSAQK